MTSENEATFAETIPGVIAGNVRAYRARRDLDQVEVVARMRNLGFNSWHRATISNIERGTRRISAAEIIGLALVLETPPVHLLGDS